MLKLFSPFQLRLLNSSKKWFWETYQWQPKAGQLTQVSMELSFNLNLFFKPNQAYDSSRLYCTQGGNVFFIQALNPSTEEALVYSPHLPDIPWVKDTWYLVDMYNLAPVTIYKFNEEGFRSEHPDKLCPYPVLWGSYVHTYNRQHL